MTAIPGEALSAYLERGAVGDHAGAAAIALELVESLPPRTVLDGLVAAAQREVGLRWHRNTCTVADEHLVTTTSAAVIEILGHRQPAPAATSDAFAIVACAEGDWHSLPARLFAEHLRLLGCEVTFLGASTPADHVASLMDRRAPDVLCISTSLPLTYRGVAALADVGRERGIATVAGGLAIGTELARAKTLGADDGATSADDVVELLRRGTGGVAAPAPPLDRGALLLDASATEMADASMAGLGELFPALRRLDAQQLRRTHEDMAYIVRFLAAALLVDDAAVWSDFVSWQVALLGARGVPERAFTAGLEALAAQLETEFPAAAGLLASQIDESGGHVTR